MMSYAGRLLGRCRWWSFFYVALLRCCITAYGVPPAADMMWTGAGETDAAWIEALSSCVVYVNDDSSGKYITGTLFYSSGPVVITNYHVLSSSTDTLRVYLSTGRGAKTFPGTVVKSDQRNDLAAIRINRRGPAIERLVTGKIAPGKSMMVTDSHYIAEDDFVDASLLRRGYPVIFLGFPLNYGLSSGGRDRALVMEPVARRGIIASGVDNDEFLVDAMFSNGNSGSPVFVRTGRQKGERYYPEYRLAGIVKQYQRDVIKVRWDGVQHELPHNAGLGIIVPVAVIRDFLKNVP